MPLCEGLLGWVTGRRKKVVRPTSRRIMNWLVMSGHNSRIGKGYGAFGSIPIFSKSWPRPYDECHGAPFLSFRCCSETHLEQLLKVEPVRLALEVNGPAAVGVLRRSKNPFDARSIWLYQRVGSRREALWGADGPGQRSARGFGASRRSLAPFCRWPSSGGGARERRSRL